MIYLDTHVLVFLAAGEPEKLSTAARHAVESEDLLASAASVLELELLHEIGRLRLSGSEMIRLLEHDIGVRVCELGFHVVVDQALKETWSRDPFDRLIVANAKANGSRLVTKDEKILRNYPGAIW